MAGPEPPERIHAATDATLLDELHAALGRLWARHPQVPIGDRMAVETAAAEIAANVVTADDGHGRAQVELRVQDGAVTVDLMAPPGPGLLPGRVEAAQMPGPDAEAGRGLALARALLDELTCTREDGADRWHLRRSLTDP